MQIVDGVQSGTEHLFGFIQMMEITSRKVITGVARTLGVQWI
jgi:hypothetical protein